MTWHCRDGCSAGAVEEDPHAGHDHRRKLMEAEEEEHDHAEDEEHDHAEEEDHDDHDHDGHGTASVLNSESLVAATANLTGGCSCHMYCRTVLQICC